MAVIIPTETRDAMIAKWFNYIVGASPVQLFVNDLTPTESTVFANVSELSATWYFPWGLSIYNYGVDSEGRAWATSYPVTYTHDGMSDPVTVYGWYMVNGDDFSLMYAERFETPKLMQYDTDSITIAPKFWLTQGMF